MSGWPRRSRMRWACSLLAAALLAACGPTGAAGGDPAPDAAAAPEAGAEASAEGERWVYRCEAGDAFSARVQGDSVTVRDGMRTHTLPRVESASGARYGAGGVTFWSRGEEATLETPDGRRRTCTGEVAADPWNEARLLGYDFRAVGQEPGWLLEIAEGRWIHLAADYGERVIHVPAPAPIEAGGATVYDARTEAHALRVEIERTPCQDTMSGESFPATVRVTLDGQEYRGCGRPLGGDAATASGLTGVRWTLTELDGGPPVAGIGDARPSLEFSAEESRVVGDTGCNQLSGRFAMEAGRLTFPEPMVTTRRACVDPDAARQEQRFLAALQRTTRHDLAEGRLTLYANDEVVARFAGEDGG
jgi:heat shock protein HslJ/membrane-bound inhibitor of C-type lysozyme